MSTTTDLETVRALARLARLELDEDELARLAPELERILTAFEVLARHPAAASPRATPAIATTPASAPRTREDEPVRSLARDELLSAAPAHEDGFFVVPRTIAGER